MKELSAATRNSDVLVLTETVDWLSVVVHLN
jgi:hypothetical protein